MHSRACTHSLLRPRRPGRRVSVVVAFGVPDGQPSSRDAILAAWAAPIPPPPHSRALPARRLPRLLRLLMRLLLRLLRLVLGVDERGREEDRARVVRRIGPG